jgi:glycosyltransferase involved in cell wall biosynthesis
VTTRIAVFAEHLCRTPSGGIGVYIKQLICALGTIEGLESIAISSPGAQVAEGCPVSTLTSPHRVTVELLHRGRSVPGWARASRDADILHATSFDLPPRDSRPLTVFVHDLLWRKFPEAYSTRGIEWHERGLERSIQRAKVLLVPSNEVRTDLIHAGADRSNVKVVGEGCDHLVVHPKRIGTYLLSVGTLQPRKNVAGLIQAYSLYRTQSAEPLPLRIVGPAGWGTELGPLPVGVSLLGSVTDSQLGDLYAGASALLLVSLGEGFGLPIGEAWSASVPVIGAHTVPCVDEHSEACLVVSPSDAQAIAAAIHTVLAGGSAITQQVARGLAIAKKMTWRHMAESHVTLWRTLQ